MFLGEINDKFRWRHILTGLLHVLYVVDGVHCRKVERSIRIPVMVVVDCGQITLIVADVRRHRTRCRRAATAAVHCTWTANYGNTQTQLASSTTWTNAAFNVFRRTGRLFWGVSSNRQELYWRRVVVGILPPPRAAGRCAGNRNICRLTDGLWMAVGRCGAWSGFGQQSPVEQVRRQCAAAIFTVVRPTEHGHMVTNNYQQQTALTHCPATSLGRLSD